MIAVADELGIVRSAQMARQKRQYCIEDGVRLFFGLHMAAGDWSSFDLVRPVFPDVERCRLSFEAPILPEDQDGAIKPAAGLAVRKVVFVIYRRRRAIVLHHGVADFRAAKRISIGIHGRFRQRRAFLRHLSERPFQKVIGVACEQALWQVVRLGKEKPVKAPSAKALSTLDQTSLVGATVSETKASTRS